jgi:integrase
MRLTDRQIASLPIPAKGQKLYSDEILPGFGVRVSQGGSKTFVLTLGANRERITLGRYGIVSLAAARDKARTILAERQLGIAQPKSKSLTAVITEYTASRADQIRPATQRTDSRLARVFADNQPINSLTAAAAEEILQRNKSPSTYVQGLVWLRGLFRFAEERDYLQKSPLRALKPPRRKEGRDRVLTDEELRATWQTAELYGYPFGTIVQLLILLGQRRQQIVSLQRSWVDLEAKVIDFPPEIMKTKRRHVIPIGTRSAELLRNVPDHSSTLFFTSDFGRPYQIWTKCTDQFWRDACVTGATLHDLRRSLATRWQELDIEIATTEKYLSHSAITGGLVGIYQRSTYMAQMRAAVERWEQFLGGLLKS